MSPCIFDCPICGWAIYDPNRSISWLTQFRGLCSSAEGGIFLTGLGLYSDPQSGAFIAPPDSSARWDDPGYENPTEHRFGAMTRRDINGKHGFLFHDDCWSLVKQAYYPAPVPLERLYSVINSLPMSLLGARVDWGHTYGGFGVALGEKKDYFPWERGLASHLFREDPPPNIQYLVSPLALSEVDDILAEPPQAFESRHMCPSQAPGSVLPSRDIFASLPEELCSAVAVRLPTDDVLNARLASRSFWNVYGSQQFWASRFRGADSERSWLFEAIEQPRSTGTGIPRRDWRWLYHRTTGARLGPAARNRKRVWALIQHLVKILDLSWNELPAQLPFHLQSPEEAIPMPTEVLVVSGSIRSYADTLVKKRARTPKLQRVAIPVDGILRIAASTVRLGELEYLAGLSLTMASGNVFRLGYSTAAGSECSVRLEGASIAGFNVAVGLGGIHALQCVSGSGTRRHVFPWLGCPGDAPRTERVSEVTSGQAMVLELSFDGFRMTGLAISVSQPVVHPPTDFGSHDDSDLRRLAIWHPDVPPRGLNLNESFVVAPDAYTWGYSPLFWTYFGGRGGVYLEALEKITIRRASGCIHFSFANLEVPDECRSFGRIANYVDRDDETESIELLIDGPGGEIIDKVELCQELIPSDFRGWLGRQGVLAWLKIHTNRGQTCEVGSKPRPGVPVVEKELSASPGTAITGFYGVQHRGVEFCLAMLGVITEPIHQA